MMVGTDVLQTSESSVKSESCSVLMQETFCWFDKEISLSLPKNLQEKKTFHATFLL